MNKAVKTTLSLAAATLATPLYFGAKSFARNKDRSFLSRSYFALITAGTMAISSASIGKLVVDNGIVKYSQSRPPVCTEEINADYFSLVSKQRTFVTPMPLRKSCFSFATPLAPLIQYALGEYPTHRETKVSGSLSHDKIDYELEATLNGLVPMPEINADSLVESAKIRVKESSIKDLLKGCEL